MIRCGIKSYVERRGITFLVHFTQAENLPLVLSHGLLPRTRFRKLPSAPKVNDQHRMDGRRNAVSVSIAFPNAPMFFAYRYEKPEVDWAVLILRPSLLWEKDCGFCRHNAADSRSSKLPLSELRSAEAFSSMFLEIPGKLSRTEQNLQPFDPTNEQAEVLVFDDIEPDYIAGVAFDSEDVRWRYDRFLGGYDTHVYPPGKGLFGARKYVLRRLDALLKPHPAFGVRGFSKAGVHQPRGKEKSLNSSEHGAAAENPTKALSGRKQDPVPRSDGRPASPRPSHRPLEAKDELNGGRPLKTGPLLKKSARLTVPSGKSFSAWVNARGIDFSTLKQGSEEVEKLRAKWMRESGIRST